MTPDAVVGWLVLGVVVAIVWAFVYDAPGAEIAAAVIVWPLFLLLILYRGLKSAILNTFK